MSTQGYYGYKENKEIKGVKLNYDAYLSYAGKRILTLIKNHNNLELQNFWNNQIQLVTENSIIEEELQLDILELNLRENDILELPINKLDYITKFISSLIGKKETINYFCDGLDFYKNGICCSNAYILDFNKEILEIWICYNNKPEIGFEDWYEKDLSGNLFYMNKLEEIPFDNIRQSNIDSLIKKLEWKDKLKNDESFNQLIKNQIEKKQDE